VVTEGRFGKQASDRLVGAQQALSRKRRGSHRRDRAAESVARAHRKVRNQRKDLAHKLSRALVNDYDLIVHEDLKITNMVRRPKPRPNKEGGFDPNGAAVLAVRVHRRSEPARPGDVLLSGLWLPGSRRRECRRQHPQGR